MSNLQNFVIYTITNLANGKKYVGQSKHVHRRWVEHRYKLNANRHDNVKLQRAWNKYGRDNFHFEIIANASSQNELNILEKKFVQQLDSCTAGYNITEGGELRHNLGIPCEWNGVKYPTLVSACRANGIKYGTTLLTWIRKGYKNDADVPPPKPGNHATACQWNNLDYPSVSAAARACGINAKNMQKRLLKGYTCDDDVPEIGPRRKPCKWKGIDYPSISEAAKASHVSVSVMSRYLRNASREEQVA